MTILKTGVFQMPPDAGLLKVAMVETTSFQSNFVAAIEAASDMAMHADGSGIDVIRAAHRGWAI